jgi:nucleolar protein 56
LSAIGVFCFGEGNQLVDRVLFEKDPAKTAEILEGIEVGRLFEEMVELIKRLQEKRYTLFVFEKPEIAKSAREKLGVEVDVETPSGAGEVLRGDLDRFALDAGLVKAPQELRVRLQEVSMELTKTRIRRKLEQRDFIVVQTIQTIDELSRTINLFRSRITEWYGLCFPELNRLIDKNETYARLVVNLGRRQSFTVENLEKEGVPKAKSEQIVRVAETSMGADLKKEDLQQIQCVCDNALKLYDARRSLEKYLDSVMEQVVPNVRALTGSLLGARLIALAGGLENLAKKPASTIQVLGAEKALFRSLKTGAPPPKHGVIFQHPVIREAKRWQKGKLSRALAGKIAIAVRTDFFSGKYIGKRLQADLDRRVKEILKRTKKAPVVRRKDKRKIRRKKNVRRS